MKNIFLQIGATRDGQNPYCAVAQRQGYFTVLIEMGDFIDYQSLCVSLPFDMILPVILGTLRLTASDRQEILTVFHSLMAKTQVSARGGMQCAE